MDHPKILRSFSDFDGIRNEARPLERARLMKLRAQAFREKLLTFPSVSYFHALPLIRVPYPTKYAFLHAYHGITPFIHILNRMFVVQFAWESKVKTLLIGPSDIEKNEATPFFMRLRQRAGPLAKMLQPLLAPKIQTVQNALKTIGLSPDEVDFISYDHLHTQDIRGWLGTNSEQAYFKNAKLIVTKEEWNSVQGLLPPQNDWYCPSGIDGIDPNKIIIFEKDCFLGESIALIKTPGHTEGNHSFAIKTEEGIYVISENGVSADCYAPLKSKIKSLKKYAQQTGMEVILNGNTLERGLDQYISMIQEKEIAGPSRLNPDFPNFIPSSEFTAHWAFPFIRPSFVFGDVKIGPLVSADLKGS